MDPPSFHAFDDSANLFVNAGIGALHGQRASLAGTRGTLEEIGLYGITWRAGRVAITASGIAVWRMSNETRVEPAHPGVGSKHQDAGPIILETSARLTPDHVPLLWLLRFGLQVPTTSLVSGLDRDEADVFATLALRTQRPLWVAAEAGTGINGRPEPALGQTDMVVYSAGAGYRGARAPVAVEMWIVGHNDLHIRRIRGNEDLSELRLGARTRGRIWMGLWWIHGLSDFSPSNGVRISAGVDAHVTRIPVLGWQ